MPLRPLRPLLAVTGRYLPFLAVTCAVAQRHLGDLSRPFPWDEVEWNRCALQLSTQTGLDEIHGIFSFMSMGQVWITSCGHLQGVVTDRALIAACLVDREA